MSFKSRATNTECNTISGVLATVYTDCICICFIGAALCTTKGPWKPLQSPTFHNISQSFVRDKMENDYCYVKRQEQGGMEWRESTVADSA